MEKKPGSDTSATPFIQPKLTINQPGDAYEQEADAMAERVMRMSDPAQPLSSPPLHTIQRKCAHCEEEDKLQRKETGDTSSTAPTSVHQTLSQSGQPLSAESRAFFEPRFGRDFSGVRIHTDGGAAKSARDINARAYTSGQNVVFGHGQYQPETERGKRLLAHELTHVVQQNHKIQRTTVDCNAQESSVITSALSLASTRLSEAIEFLRVRPLSPRVMQSLWLFFRDHSVSVADQVMASLQRIQTRLTAVNIECENDCQEDKLGYTRFGSVITGWGNVHICMNNFNNDIDKIANTLIHELSHFVLGTSDFSAYYNDSSCFDSEATVSLGSSSRLNHADSLSCFVLSRHQHSDVEINEQWSDVTGRSIKGIQQSPTGDISLSNSQIRRPLFSVINNNNRLAIITGIDYRWSLKDAADNRYLMTAPAGKVLQQYSPSLESVNAIINRKTRDLLIARGVTSGEVLCRAQIRSTLPDTEILLNLPVRFSP